MYAGGQNSVLSDQRYSVDTVEDIFDFDSPQLTHFCCNCTSLDNGIRVTGFCYVLLAFLYFYLVLVNFDHEWYWLFHAAIFVFILLPRVLTFVRMARNDTPRSRKVFYLSNLVGCFLWLLFYSAEWIYQSSHEKQETWVDFLIEFGLFLMQVYFMLLSKSYWNEYESSRDRSVRYLSEDLQVEPDLKLSWQQRAHGSSKSSLLSSDSPLKVKKPQLYQTKQNQLVADPESLLAPTFNQDNQRRNSDVSPFRNQLLVNASEDHVSILDKHETEVIYNEFDREWSHSDRLSSIASENASQL